MNSFPTIRKKQYTLDQRLVVPGPNLIQKEVIIRIYKITGEAASMLLGLTGRYAVGGGGWTLLVARKGNMNSFATIYENVAVT